ncbi:MAG: GNAT family N-acetyltransferase [Bacteroidota bacterium]
MDNLHIREISKQDWDAVAPIYESGIATGYATFETSAPAWDEWDKAHLQFGRLLAVLDNQVVGWAALSPVSSRCVYGGVAEVSVYVHEEFRGKRIGQKLQLAKSV